jgi:dTDP-4-amino-4,6-dideoxygalactose transaminase
MGYNARMDTLQAAFLAHKLPLLDVWNEERRQLAGRYLRKLQSCKGITIPMVEDFAAHVFHLFVIRSARRNQLQQFLVEQGIQTLIHYPIPNHLQPALAHLGHGEGSFPITEQIAATCLSLPLFIGMKTEEIDYVAKKIHEFTALNS